LAKGFFSVYSKDFCKDFAQHVGVTLMPEPVESDNLRRLRARIAALRGPLGSGGGCRIVPASERESGLHRRSGEGSGSGTFRPAGVVLAAAPGVRKRAQEQDSDTAASSVRRGSPLCKGERAWRKLQGEDLADKKKEKRRRSKSPTQLGVCSSPLKLATGLDVDGYKSLANWHVVQANEHLRLSRLYTGLARSLEDNKAGEPPKQSAANKRRTIKRRKAAARK